MRLTSPSSSSSSSRRTWPTAPLLVSLFFVLFLQIVTAAHADETRQHVRPDDGLRFAKRMIPQVTNSKRPEDGKGSVNVRPSPSEKQDAAGARTEAKAGSEASVVGRRDVTRSFHIYDPGFVKDLVKEIRVTEPCANALAKPVLCADFVASFQSRSRGESLHNDTLTDMICAKECKDSLTGWVADVRRSCPGVEIGGASVIAPVQLMLEGIEETCLRDKETGRYCNDIIDGFRDVSSVEQMAHNELCSYCYVRRLSMMQGTLFSAYNKGFADTQLQYVDQHCDKQVLKSFALPTQRRAEEDEEPECRTKTWMTVSEKTTCDGIASDKNVSSHRLLLSNLRRLSNCGADSYIEPGTELCLPPSCGRTYRITNDTETCESIESKPEEELEPGQILKYNHWVRSMCTVLNANRHLYGSTICLGPRRKAAAAAPAPAGAAPSAGKALSRRQVAYAMVAVAPPAGKVAAPGTTLNCLQWDVAQKGDTCVSMCVRNGITSRLLLQGNPSLGKMLGTCTNQLKEGLAYCVGPMQDMMDDGSDPEEVIYGLEGARADSGGARIDSEEDGSRSEADDGGNSVKEAKKNAKKASSGSVKAGEDDFREARSGPDGPSFSVLKYGGLVDRWRWDEDWVTYGAGEFDSGHPWLTAKVPRDGEVMAINMFNYSDFVLEAVVRLEGPVGEAGGGDGEAGFVFRASTATGRTTGNHGPDDLNGYYLGLSYSGFVVFGRAELGIRTELARARMDWHVLNIHPVRVQAIGDRITVEVDDRMVVDVVDTAFGDGGFGMRVHNTSSASFNRVRMAPVWHADFAKTGLDGWTAYEGSFSVASRALTGESMGGGGGKMIARGAFRDFALEANITVRSGGKANGGLLFRVVGASLGSDGFKGYYVGITDGFVVLGRSDYAWRQLQQAAVEGGPGTPHHVKVKAYKDRILVFVDGKPTPAIDVHDDTYVKGAVGVRIYQTSATIVDMKLVPIDDVWS